jgi:arginase family enzyme
MIFDLLDPIDIQYLSEEKPYLTYEVGHNIQFLEGEHYQLDQYDIALLGVKEGRLAVNKNVSCDIGPEEIRKSLYRLAVCDSFPKIIDLGNVIDTETVEETYEHVEKIASFIAENNVILIILGGSQDLTIPQFAGLGKLYNNANLLVLDERIDIKNSAEKVASDAFLQKIAEGSNPYLFNLSILGIQSYFVPQNTQKILESMYYELYKLGEIRHNLLHYEFLFREANAVSIDVNCIKQADAPGRSMQTPNGLFSDEICHATRLAGMSQNVNSLGIYEFNPQFDIRNQTAMLLAQAVWYFIEGFTHRTNDFTFQFNEKAHFKNYITEISGLKHPLIFWLNEQTNQWWVEITHEKNGQKMTFSCSNIDFIEASRGSISSRIHNLMIKTL